MAERGHRYEDVMAAINARRPDFNAYIEPQKEFANVVIQVLPTQLIKEDKERGYCGYACSSRRVRGLEPVYLFDEGQQFIGRPVEPPAPTQVCKCSTAQMSTTVATSPSQSGWSVRQAGGELHRDPPQ